MFIIVYRGEDNDLHILRYKEHELVGGEIESLLNKAWQSDTRISAEIHAKKNCPYEWEVFTINW